MLKEHPERPEHDVKVLIFPVMIQANMTWTNTLKGGKMYIAFDTANSTYHVSSRGELLWSSNGLAMPGTSEVFAMVSDIKVGNRAKFGIGVPAALFHDGKFVGTWVTTPVVEVRVIGSAYVRPEQRTVTA